MKRLVRAAALLAGMSAVSLAQGLEKVVEESGVRGGLVVHLGCGNGKSTVDLKVNDSVIVHGLDTDQDEIAKAREFIRSQSTYGSVAVSVFDGTHLPYADNLVNLVVAADPAGVGMQEIMRVVVPDGVVALKKGESWEYTEKPRPAEMDEWGQWMHEPDNVLVSRDTLVGPPRCIQWQAEPKWALAHNDVSVRTTVNVIISANGRVFYDVNDGLPGIPQNRSIYQLVARDAFNGVELWKRPMKDWYEGQEYRRGNPPAVQRRMACVGDRLFITMSSAAPVMCLDAATGRHLKTFAETEGAEELVLADGKLWVIVWDHGEPVMKKYQDKEHKVQNVRTRLLVLDPNSGKLLWERSDDDASMIYPQSLAIKDGRGYFKTPKWLHCIDARNGKAIWKAELGVDLDKELQIRPVWLWSTQPNPWYWHIQNVSRVMVLDDTILTVAVDPEHQQSSIDNAPQGTLFALSRADGKIRWRAPAGIGFCSPPDILPVGDKVYVGLGPTGGYNVFDLKTGEKLSKFGVYRKGMCHYRCYRRLATSGFVISAGAGTEFVDVATGKQYVNHTIRGDCVAGVLPANGLLYVTPHPCACFGRVMLNGMLAFSGEIQGAAEKKMGKGRLEKGPAYGLKADPSDQESKDWPTFRHDPSRSGSTPAAVSPRLEPAWSTVLDGRLSAMTVSDGRLYVAAVDQHTVHALNAESGEVIWSFTAGGRIDSPPTIRGDCAVFGSRDGWVYCLRSSDGRLVWRYCIESEEKLVGIRNQLESVWPAHGSVLILDRPPINGGAPVVYFSGGRNSFIDGGMYLCGLDLETGKTVARKRVYGPEDEQGFPISEKLFYINGARSDILVSDEDAIYMKDMAFDLACEGITSPGKPHLVTTAISLLDDSWHHRGTWFLDTEALYSPRTEAFGQYMVFDEKRLFALQSHKGRRGSRFRPERGYTLVGLSYRHNDEVQDDSKGPGQKTAPAVTTEQLWLSRGGGVVFKALALTGSRDDDAQGVLFGAGPPNLKTDPQIREALEGKHGGILRAISTSDGKTLAEYRLESPPVLDGMAAVEGRLYLSLVDGRIVCMKEELDK